MSRTFALLVTFVAFAISAFVVHATPEPPKKIDKLRDVKGISIESLEWMAGSYSSTSKEGRSTTVVEELWIAPKGGVMLGVHRETENRVSVSHEFLRIEQTREKIVLTPYPSGNKSVGFDLVAVSEKRAVFENLAHDFPQRIVYWRNQGGDLCARVEGKQDGVVVTNEWCWQRRE